MRASLLAALMFFASPRPVLRCPQRRPAGSMLGPERPARDRLRRPADSDQDVLRRRRSRSGGQAKANLHRGARADGRGVRRHQQDAGDHRSQVPANRRRGRGRHAGPVPVTFPPAVWLDQSGAGRGKESNDARIPSFAREESSPASAPRRLRGAPSVRPTPPRPSPRRAARTNSAGAPIWGRFAARRSGSRWRAGSSSTARAESPIRRTSAAFTVSARPPPNSRYEGPRSPGPGNRRSIRPVAR